MKKVLFVATVVKTHIHTFHLPYLRWFRENGWETSVAAKNDFGDEPCAIPHCDHYYDIPFARFPFHPKNVRAYIQLKTLMRKNGYDLIHCHTPVGSVLARLAARKSRKQGTRVIYTAHGFHFYRGASWLHWIFYYTIEKICAKYTDILITINQEDYTFSKKKLKAKRIFYVPGVGVDTKRFQRASSCREEVRAELNIPADAKVLISVGEINKNKNHVAVILAMATCHDQTIHYILAGKGPEMERLKRKAVRLGIQSRVHFLGFRRDIPRLYSASDILVFPSKREGLPVAVMEAMAGGLPVICSPIRGNTDLVEDKWGGYLLDCNDPERLAATIDGLDGQTGEKMGRFNMEKIKQYDLKNVLDRMKKIYRGLSE
ncbi:MAG TPA: glycosyltransferase family 1 protein [Clostridiales bacterium]|nr:glycosyltransferase family 1 protein [Clostridiales bacterium]